MLALLVLMMKFLLYHYSKLFNLYLSEYIKLRLFRWLIPVLFVRHWSNQSQICISLLCLSFFTLTNFKWFFKEQTILLLYSQLSLFLPLFIFDLKWSFFIQEHQCESLPIIVLSETDKIVLFFMNFLDKSSCSYLPDLNCVCCRFKRTKMWDMFSWTKVLIQLAVSYQMFRFLL